MNEIGKNDNMDIKSIKVLEAVSTILLGPTIILGITAIVGDSLNNIIGWAICFWGVTVFALCGVLNSIVKNLIEIRKNMEKE